MAADDFRTQRFRDHASRTFGRMGYTTLRRTGLEDVLKSATTQNLNVLERSMSQQEFGKFKAACSPEGVWTEIVRRNLASAPGVKRIVPMSLGDPSAYPDYPTNGHVSQRMAELFADPGFLRQSSRYTNSFGYPPLRDRMKSVSFADPLSINTDPGRFKDVEVYLTAGASDATEFAMAPLLLTLNDTILVHDWTYVIHLGAAYYRGAHVESYALGDDGRPSSTMLGNALQTSENRGDRDVQAVVFTPIGNPIGAAMTSQEIADHLRIISDEGKKLSRPIAAIVDIAYEPFRRDGRPLDPIAIAMDNGIPGPVIVLDTASKGYGLCGWRIGKLAVYWPRDHFPDYRHDYFKALENRMLPKLGVAFVPAQIAFNNFFNMLAEDPEFLNSTLNFFNTRREKISTNLLFIANTLRKIPGVYLARYYDNGGTLDPTTLSSFYLMFGFTRLSQKYGSSFNQALAFGEFCMDRSNLAVVNCVPGQSFLPQKRWADHPALIRITGLTGAEDTEAFLTSVRAFAHYLD